MDDRFLEFSEGMVLRETDATARKVQQALQPSHRTWCEDCDCAIEPARLQAAPFAVRCVTCQQAHERAKRQFR